MSLGERLKVEREKLGFNQNDFAEMVGASRKSQIRWEKDESSPSAEALAIWSKVGLDTQYILTGIRKTVLEDLGEQGYLPGQLFIKEATANYESNRYQQQNDMLQPTNDELELIERYRNASFEVKAQIMQLLSGVEIKSNTQSSQIFHGDVSSGEFAARDIVNNRQKMKK